MNSYTVNIKNEKEKKELKIRYKYKIYHMKL